jgi:hypothetical protein
MKHILDKNGNLNIEDLVVNNPSFIAYLADNVITKEEKTAQVAKIESIIREIDEKCSDEERELVRKLVAELSVLLVMNYLNQ